MRATASASIRVNCRIAKDCHGCPRPLITNIDANREGIKNCVRDGAHGWWVIEKTIDVAVRRRLKATCTSWFRPGVDRLLSLRTPKRDRTWNSYWQARRSRTSWIAALAP